MTLNEQVFIFINQTASNSVFDLVMPAITDLHKTIWFHIIVLPLLLFFFFKKDRKKYWFYFLSLLITVGISDFVGGKVKNNFPSPRPFQFQNLNPIQRSTASEDTSFYSNHSSNNFAFASTASYYFSQYQVVFYSIAFIVAYSRVYNGVHFPLDVAAGAFAGVLIAYIMRKVFYKLESKVFGR